MWKVKQSSLLILILGGSVNLAARELQPNQNQVYHTGLQRYVSQRDYLAIPHYLDGQLRIE